MSKPLSCSPAGPDWAEQARQIVREKCAFATMPMRWQLEKAVEFAPRSSVPQAENWQDWHKLCLDAQELAQKAMTALREKEQEIERLHHPVCNFPSQPFGKNGCICIVIPRGSVERVEAENAELHKTLTDLREKRAADWKCLENLKKDCTELRKQVEQAEQALTEEIAVRDEIIAIVDPKHEHPKEGYFGSPQETVKSAIAELRKEQNVQDWILKNALQVIADVWKELGMAKTSSERIAQIDDQISKLRRELRDYELQALAHDEEHETHDLDQIELLELEILSLKNERSELLHAYCYRP